MSPRTWEWVVFFFLLVTTLLAACSSSSTQSRTTPSATAAPTATKAARDLPTASPRPTPLIAGPSVRLCHGDDIAASASPNGAGGMFFAFIVLANPSGTPCQLLQMPEMQLLTSSGEVVPATLQLGRPCPEGIWDSCVFQQPLLLAPGAPARYPPQPGQALLELAWPYRGYNGYPCPTQTPKATQLKLLLRGTDSTAVVDVTNLSQGGILQCLGGIDVISYGPP